MCDVSQTEQGPTRIKTAIRGKKKKFKKAHRGPLSCTMISILKFLCVLCVVGERRAELLCLTATDHSFYSFAVQVLGVPLKKNRKCIFTKLYKKKDGEQKLVFSTG